MSALYLLASGKLNSESAMVKPYRQGDLDCLCGLYAVINSIRFSLSQYHPLRKQDCRAIYYELIDHLEGTEYLTEALTSGLVTPEISRLLRVAEGWLLETKGITVRHRKPFHRYPRIPYSKLIGKLSSHLANPGTAVLALALGRVDHWTVAHSINRKSLRLFDSGGMHRFGLHSIHSDPPEISGKTLHLVPTGLFLIESIAR